MKEYTEAEVRLIIEGAIAAERDRLMLAAERCIVCEQRRIRHEISTENAPNQ